MAATKEENRSVAETKPGRSQNDRILKAAAAGLARTNRDGVKSWLEENRGNSTVTGAVKAVFPEDNSRWLDGHENLLDLIQDPEFGAIAPQRERLTRITKELEAVKRATPT